MITDSDREYIGEDISQGYNVGQFLGEGNKRISWELTINIID
jgi:hypothetical protein